MTVQLADPPMVSARRKSKSDEPLYEIVNGQKVEVQPLAMRSNRVAAEIFYVLFGHLRNTPKLGCAVFESLFHMPATGNDRRPDVAYISAERLPLSKSMEPEGDFPVAPQLAVEVTSPNDTSRELENKIQEYFRNEVKQVWVVHPEVRQIKVYDAPNVSRILGDGDTLRTDLLPGFEVAVESLFPKE